jgi:hypothetical protein
MRPARSRGRQRHQITFVTRPAAHLAGGLTRLTAGNLLENFVLGELGRQITGASPSSNSSTTEIATSGSRRYWKTSQAGSSASRSSCDVGPLDDFRGLRVLRDKLGDRFHAGFVLYCGHERPAGGGLGCLPISALWRTALAELAPRPERTAPAAPRPAQNHPFWTR